MGNVRQTCWITQVSMLVLSSVEYRHIFSLNVCGVSHFVLFNLLFWSHALNCLNLCIFFDPCIFLLQMCEQAGEDLVPCEGQCCGMFHLHCLGLLLKPDEKLLCQECSTGEEFTLSRKQRLVTLCYDKWPLVVLLSVFDWSHHII